MIIFKNINYHVMINFGLINIFISFKKMVILLIMIINWLNVKCHI